MEKQAVTDLGAKSTAVVRVKEIIKALITYHQKQGLCTGKRSYKDSSCEQG
jgi:hypothetical protein